MSPVRLLSSSAAGNTFGARAPLSAKHQAAARAVAKRVQVAEHTLRVPPYMQDDLAFPATLPSADV